MKKNNLFNRIFHSKEVAENKASYLTNKTKLANSHILDWIKQATDLTSLLALHKEAWRAGFHNNIDPCPYGIFRTKDILTMSPEEVFLGGIYGLSTRNIPFWEEHHDEEWGTNGFAIDPDKLIYDTIVAQYRQHLLSNIMWELGTAEAANKLLNQYNYGND